MVTKIFKHISCGDKSYEAGRFKGLQRLHRIIDQQGKWKWR